jgi:hypothetical protein
MFHPDTIRAIVAAALVKCGCSYFGLLPDFMGDFFSGDLHSALSEDVISKIARLGGLFNRAAHIDITCVRHA